MPDGVIKDNSLFRALQNSITDGALYRYRDPKTGDGDIEKMLGVLRPFWTAVEMVFPAAWGLPARKSRLMHGAGIVSLSYVMDSIVESSLYNDGEPDVVTFVRGLKSIKPVCRWSSGTWEFGNGVTQEWNGIQNTTKDAQLLTSYLLFELRRSNEK